jgi:hypothetical protein
MKLDGFADVCNSVNQADAQVKTVLLASRIDKTSKLHYDAHDAANNCRNTDNYSLSFSYLSLSPLSRRLIMAASFCKNY